MYSIVTMVFKLSKFCLCTKNKNSFFSKKHTKNKRSKAMKNIPPPDAVHLQYQVLNP